MARFVLAEEFSCDLVATPVAGAEIEIDAQPHAPPGHTSGRYWNSRMPGLTRGISPDLIA